MNLENMLKLFWLRAFFVLLPLSGCQPEKEKDLNAGDTTSTTMLRSLPLKRLGGGSCSYTAAISLLAIYPGINDLADEKDHALSPLKREEVAGFTDAQEELAQARKVQHLLAETIHAIKNGAGRDEASEKNRLLIASVDDYKAKRGKNFAHTAGSSLVRHNICSAGDFRIYLLDILSILRAVFNFNVNGAGEFYISFKEKSLSLENFMGVAIGTPPGGGVAGVAGIHAVAVYNSKNVFGTDGYLLIDDLKNEPVAISSADLKLVLNKANGVLYLFR